MNKFRLKKHYVKEASFTVNKEKAKSKNIEVNVEGGALIPKNTENRKSFAVRLKLYLGKSDEHIHLSLETLTVFETESNDEITERDIQEECVPIALAEIRKTVKKVTEAYGMPALDLPPFEEETMEN